MFLFEYLTTVNASYEMQQKCSSLKKGKKISIFEQQKKLFFLFYINMLAGNSGEWEITLAQYNYWLFSGVEATEVYCRKWA